MKLALSTAGPSSVCPDTTSNIRHRFAAARRQVALASLAAITLHTGAADSQSGLKGDRPSFILLQLFVEPRWVEVRAVWPGDGAEFELGL